MALDTPPKANQPPDQKLDFKPGTQFDLRSDQERALATSSDLLRQQSFRAVSERWGLQSATASGNSTDKSAPVFYDKERGWYQKDATGQEVSFNGGSKPYYDEAKAEWVKPFDATPPKVFPPREAQPNRANFEPQEQTRVTPTPPIAQRYRPTEQNRAIVIDNQQAFNDLVLNAKGPAFVDFGATWCGPCQRMQSTVDGLAREFSGRVPVYKVEVDKSPWAAQYASSYPTFTMFNNGQPVGSTEGLQPAGGLRNLINGFSPAQMAPERPLPIPLVPHPPLGPHNPVGPHAPFAPRPSLVPHPGGRPLENIRPPQPSAQINDQPLLSGSREPFQSQQERDNFERFAISKGYTPKQILRAESMSPQEWACFDSINAYRSQQGLQPLHFSPRVKLVSDYQADRQAAARQMTHGNPGQPYNPQHPYHLERLAKVGLGADGMHDGENAAEGAWGGQDVTAMWLKSSGHLRPIKDGQLKIGAVSCATSTHGTPYWTFDASTGRERLNT